MFEFKINKIEDWENLSDYTEKQVQDFLKLYHKTVFTRDNCDRCDMVGGLMFHDTDVSITIVGKLDEGEFDQVISDLISTLHEHYDDTGLEFKPMTSFFNKVIIDMNYAKMEEEYVISMIDAELELV